MTEARVFDKSANGSTTAIHKKYLCIRQQQLLSLILFSSGFLAVQRFILSPINAVICAIPLGLFVVQMLRGYHQTALTYLVLALFLSIDNGGGVYTETIVPLRYFIYVSAITMLFYLSSRQIQRRRLLLAALLCCGIAFGTVTTLFGSVPIDLATLQRDLMVLFILFIFLRAPTSTGLDLHLIFSGTFGYLVGEVVNIFLFYKDNTDYLSYDSLKAFIVFPLIYTLLTRRNFVIQVIMAIATLYVIFFYGTRMITLSIFVFMSAALVINSIRNRLGKNLLGFLVALIVLVNINPIESLADTEYMQFKGIAFLVKIQENFETSDIYQIFRLLDPVRFTEHQLFFERPILEVIFGSGIGSGIYDANGALAFVTFDMTAFTDQEINSSTFYNFHDFWIDFGLRFGLLSVAYLIYKVVLQEMRNNRPWHGVLFGMLLVNTTFATSGLLLTALLVRFFPRTLENNFRT
jgi:hypothetical protein